MYNNYVRTRLSQNEIDLSDLRLGYERATQDDRIRAIRLGTENLENQVRKSAVDANIAEKTEQNKIMQEQIKTENDLEVLNQNKIKSNYMPKEYQAKINQANAGASNLWASTRATNQNIFLQKKAYEENESAKKVMSDFNEFSLKHPNLKGDDLKNAYYKYLSYMQMASLNDPLIKDTPTRIMNAQKYLDKQRLFEKHLGYAGQNYRANEDNFNPIPKGGNGANGSRYNGISNVDLAMFNKVQEQNVIINKEIYTLSKELEDKKNLYNIGKNKLGTDTLNKQLDEIKTIEQKIQNLKNEKNILDEKLGSYQLEVYGLVKQRLINEGVSKPDEELKYIKDLTSMVVAMDELYKAIEANGKDYNFGKQGWVGSVVDMAKGNTHPTDHIANKVRNVKQVFQTSGIKLKQEYANFNDMFPTEYAFLQTKDRYVSLLKDIQSSLNAKINAAVMGYSKETQEDIKNLINSHYKTVLANK